jgi:hypothetical protein
VRVAPYTNESPYAITAEETLPTRKNLSAASTDSSWFFMKPAST